MLLLLWSAQIVAEEQTIAVGILVAEGQIVVVAGVEFERLVGLVLPPVAVFATKRFAERIAARFAAVPTPVSGRSGSNC